MTTTPAPGADLATDEQIIAKFEAAISEDPAAYSRPGECVYQITRDEVLAYSRSLAAVPASEPVAVVTGSTVQWLPGAGALKDRAELYAASAPVSGMPDLTARLNEIDRHLAKCRFTERHAARQLVYSMLHDVCGIPSPQAPDTSNHTGATK